MKVSEDVINTIDAGTYDGPLYLLPNQLDRKAYVSVNKVLVAAGGKWNRAKKAHVFPRDAEDMLSDVILTGEVTDKKKEFDFFETPDAVSTAMLDCIEMWDDIRVLEPSAGGGRLARAAIGRGAIVDCVELQPELAANLLSDPTIRHTMHCDFLKLNPVAKYDAVIMNPPFGKQADLHHVRHAMGFLKMGGQLIAVMSAGVIFRTNKLTKEFKEMLYANDGKMIELPDSSFKTSGTMVNTVMVMMTKVA